MLKMLIAINLVVGLDSHNETLRPLRRIEQD